jgi:hypothetical protein
MDEALTPYTLLIRTLALVAVVWAAAVTVRIMASPAVVTVMEATAVGQPPSEPVVIGWFEYAGFYGTVLLLLWTALFGLGAWAAWMGRTAVLTLIAIPTLIFSWLTLFSFGGGYIPATISLAAALILLGLQRRKIT